MTDENFSATAALVGFLRMEADLSEEKARRLRQQAATLAQQFGVSNTAQDAYGKLLASAGRLLWHPLSCHCSNGNHYLQSWILVKCHLWMKMEFQSTRERREDGSPSPGNGSTTRTDGNANIQGTLSTCKRTILLSKRPTQILHPRISLLC